jgi:hypothetical protein
MFVCEAVVGLTSTSAGAKVTADSSTFSLLRVALRVCSTGVDDDDDDDGDDDGDDDEDEEKEKKKW